MTAPEIAGRKAELIAAIGRRNPGATPAFLQAFTPDALSRYLDRLERVTQTQEIAADGIDGIDDHEGVGPVVSAAA